MTAHWVSGLVGLALAGSVAGYVSWQAAKSPQTPEIVYAAPPCDPAPAFRVVEDPFDTIKPTAGGWEWGSQGVIEMRPCTGGTMTISGYGVGAGGDWPLLIASLGREGLGNWTFKSQRDLTVKVPHGGAVTLAFMNAYYDASQRPIQRRELHLHEVRFTPTP
ncbi:hypothetical protein [Deinococcus arenicola]|uniref:Uncharacterized protein n=1 Tax=Deinococcus arenicola TaxID=2994950 RepID=A0ABU4DUB3_9DEIO|nr:hypothetical protein [Deinococcus sp. ZS9-10]MDV6376026.1 hypothetical protein [Deinococcus sp. ZS9-10]